MQADKRPVFLNLLQIRMPVTALMSILHRVTGVVLILLLPFFLYWLQRSVMSPDGFIQARSIFYDLPGQIVLFLLAWVLLHHLLAGLRYLLIDLDIGVERYVANCSAAAVMILAPVVALLAVLVL